MGKRILAEITKALASSLINAWYERPSGGECGHYGVKIKDDVGLTEVEGMLSKVAKKYDLHMDFHDSNEDKTFDLNAYWDTKEKIE